jgi:hypothetical protein
MALPCHLIAQKCHSSKLLQAKPLRGVGEEFPILPVTRTPRVGELSVGDQRLDLDLQVHHHHQAAHPDSARGDCRQEARMPSRLEITLHCGSPPSPKPHCIIPSSINRELLS